MDNRFIVFLYAIRESALVFLAAVEDYLDIPYDKSALARRRHKVKELHG